MQRPHILIHGSRLKPPIAITITSFAMALLCLIRALRYWYIGGSSLGTAVSYPQFMETREQLRKEIGERDSLIANLNVELATLREALQKTKQDATAREFDPVRKASFAHWAKDHVADLKQKAIYVFAVPTAFDSTVVAGHICEMLKWAGATAVHMRQVNTFMEVLDPLQSFGIWIFGDSQSALVRALVTELREGGLFTVFRPWSAVPQARAGDDHSIVIIVGDRGDGLRGSRYDHAAGGDLAGELPVAASNGG